MKLLNRVSRSGLILGAITAVTVGTLTPVVTSAAASAGHQAHAQGTPAALLAHWWKALGNANDSVGVDNGTRQGAGFGPGVKGGSDQAFAFYNGANQVVFNKGGGNRRLADFTFAFDIWTTATRYQAVWEKRPLSCNPGSTPGWDFRMGHVPNGKIGFEIFANRVSYAVPSTTPINDGGWHEVAVTRHGRTLHLYIDGNLEGTTTTATTINLTNDAPMRAGVSTCDGVDGTNPFTGESDELMIFRSVLSPAQIRALSATQLQALRS
jgi:Concanavalin A-like lectin/glucanases superfamily